MSVMPSNKKMLSLYRYYAWADYMRLLFQKSLERENEFTVRGEEGTDTFCTMSYWYSGLFVVVDGWRDLKIEDDHVEGLLSDEKYLGLLRRYRNATFHYHDEYFHEKYRELWREGKSAADWVQDLHDGLGNYLESWLKESGLKDQSDANMNRKKN